MTEQEIDTIVGRTRREYREAKRRLAALRASADQYSNVAYRVQLALGEPSRARFVEDTFQFEVRGNLVGAPIPFRESEMRDFTSEKIKQLIADNVAQEKVVAALRKQLFDLEGTDPDVAA